MLASLRSRAVELLRHAMVRYIERNGNAMTVVVGDDEVHVVLMSRPQHHVWRHVVDSEQVLWSPSRPVWLVDPKGTQI